MHPLVLAARTQEPCTTLSSLLPLSRAAKNQHTRPHWIRRYDLGLDQHLAPRTSHLVSSQFALNNLEQSTNRDSRVHQPSSLQPTATPAGPSRHGLHSALPLKHHSIIPAIPATLTFSALDSTLNPQLPSPSPSPSWSRRPSRWRPQPSSRARSPRIPMRSWISTCATMPGLHPSSPLPTCDADPSANTSPHCRTVTVQDPRNLPDSFIQRLK